MFPNDHLVFDYLSNDDDFITKPEIEAAISSVSAPLPTPPATPTHYE